MMPSPGHSFRNPVLRAAVFVAAPRARYWANSVLLTNQYGPPVALHAPLDEDTKKSCLRPSEHKQGHTRYSARGDGI